MITKKIIYLILKGQINFILDKAMTFMTMLIINIMIYSLSFYILGDFFTYTLAKLAPKFSNHIAELFIFCLCVYIGYKIPQSFKYTYTLVDFQNTPSTLRSHPLAWAGRIGCPLNDRIFTSIILFITQIIWLSAIILITLLFKHDESWPLFMLPYLIGSALYGIIYLFSNLKDHQIVSPKSYQLNHYARLVESLGPSIGLKFVHVRWILAPIKHQLILQLNMILYFCLLLSTLATHFIAQNLAITFVMTVLSGLSISLLFLHLVQKDLKNKAFQRSQGLSQGQYLGSLEFLNMGLFFLNLLIILPIGMITQIIDPMLSLDIWFYAIKIPCLIFVAPFLVPYLLFQFNPNSTKSVFLILSLISLFLTTAIFSHIASLILLPIIRYYGLASQQRRYDRS